MNSLKLGLLNKKERAASAVLSLVCSLACLVCVAAVFAASSGELEVAVAWLKPAPAASAVAARGPVKPARG